MDRSQKYLAILLIATIVIVSATSVDTFTKPPQVTGSLAGTATFTILPEEVPVPPEPPAPPRKIGPSAPIYAPLLPEYYIGNLDIKDQYEFEPFTEEFWIYTFKEKNYTFQLLSIEDKLVTLKHIELDLLIALEEDETIQIDSDEDNINDAFIHVIDVRSEDERPLIEIYLERPLLRIVHFSNLLFFALAAAVISVILMYLFATTPRLVRLCGRCSSTKIKELVKKNKKTYQKTPDTKYEFKPHKCLSCKYKGKFFPVINKTKLSKLQKEVKNFKRISRLKYPKEIPKGRATICGRCGSTAIVKALTTRGIIKQCQTCKHTGKFFFKVDHYTALKLKREINKLRSNKSYYNSR
jgi:hypothetical protein